MAEFRYIVQGQTEVVTVTDDSTPLRKLPFEVEKEIRVAVAKNNRKLNQTRYDIFNPGSRLLSWSTACLMVQ